MRAAIVGARGQLGRALREQLGPLVVWASDRHELDVRDEAAVTRMMQEATPDVVFNASAYNAVDAAETATGDAFAVNALGARHLATAARRAGALLVHVSTDYVFDGTKGRPYVEYDCPHPLGAYGTSKLAGELLVAASGCAFVVVRTSGVLGVGGSAAKGGSFVERIVKKAREGGPLRVVSDQVFSPTYAPDLAKALIAIVNAGGRGMFHVTNSGECSWHELAQAALRHAGLDVPIEKIKTADLNLPAARPAYSVLAAERYAAAGLPALRHWKETLPELLS